SQPRLIPIVDTDGHLEGVVTRFDLRQLSERVHTGGAVRLDTILKRNVTVAYPDEPLRSIAHRMAETGLTRFPVVERGSGDRRRLVGMISLKDLLKARLRNLEAERRRQRILTWRP